MKKIISIATYPRKYILCAGVFTLWMASACQVVKPYQKVYLNDQKMQFDANGMKKFENYFQSIREGATMPGFDKSSGGCGCN
ncbi:MAG: DUF4266 domain-containing protein [Bacteroidia bacterium]|nr:DUF4266 domain-containing protein [Bacteroidota bacterium]MBP7245598.1 DUF4266 domain-containing protein [Bacteroidia bacterium]